MERTRRQSSQAAKTWGLELASGLVQMVSNCYSKGNTLFEYHYESSRLSWDVSLLTGYNYPLRFENDGQRLLDDVTGPSCGGVRKGLFPCTQKANACVEGSTKWQQSCCDTTDQDHDCNPSDFIGNTQNLVLTFCPSQESFLLMPILMLSSKAEVIL